MARTDSEEGEQSWKCLKCLARISCSRGIYTALLGDKIILGRHYTLYIYIPNKKNENWQYKETTIKERKNSYFLQKHRSNIHNVIVIEIQEDESNVMMLARKCWTCIIICNNEEIAMYQLEGIIPRLDMSKFNTCQSKRKRNYLVRNEERP
jgi:hypothetical protein